VPNSPSDTPQSPRHVTDHADVATCPSPPRSAPSEARQLLLPVLMQNARLRDNYGDKHPEKAMDEIKAVLTDEVCDEFVKMAKQAKMQMEDRKAGLESSTGDADDSLELGLTSRRDWTADVLPQSAVITETSSSRREDANLPTAPRAMRKSYAHAANGDQRQRPPEPRSPPAEQGPSHSYCPTRKYRSSRSPSFQRFDKRRRSMTDKSPSYRYLSRSPPPRFNEGPILPHSSDVRPRKRRKLSTERFSSRHPATYRQSYSPEMERFSRPRRRSADRFRSRSPPPHQRAHGFERGRHRSRSLIDRHRGRSSHSQSPSVSTHHEDSRHCGSDSTASFPSPAHYISLRVPSVPFKYRSQRNSENEKNPDHSQPAQRAAVATRPVQTNQASGDYYPHPAPGTKSPNYIIANDPAPPQLPFLPIPRPELISDAMSLQPVPTDIKCPVPGFWFVRLGSKHADILEMSFEVENEVYEAIARADK
jgi:hypothetical protein